MAPWLGVLIKDLRLVFRSPSEMGLFLMPAAATVPVAISVAMFCGRRGSGGGHHVTASQRPRSQATSPYTSPVGYILVTAVGGLVVFLPATAAMVVALSGLGAAPWLGPLPIHLLVGALEVAVAALYLALGNGPQGTARKEPP